MTVRTYHGARTIHAASAHLRRTAGRVVPYVVIAVALAATALDAARWWMAWTTPVGATAGRASDAPGAGRIAGRPGAATRRRPGETLGGPSPARAASIADWLTRIEHSANGQVALLRIGADASSGRLSLSVRARSAAELFAFADRLRSVGGFGVQIDRHVALPRGSTIWTIESLLSLRSRPA